jgi:lipid II:glycine glycyltransferase (peptidoglycan interpeptide bridge formation enzyme)
VREDHLKLNPIKMLIDEMRIRARREGYTYFNLGGGVANMEDSLFRFKQGFSKDIRPFNVWRYIVNREVYDELVQRKAAVHCAMSPKPCNDFFPCYRCESPLILK